MNQTPPELDSARSMMRIAKIITIVLLIITVLAAAGSAIAVLTVTSTANAAGVSTGALSGFYAIYVGFFVIALLIQLVIYMMIGQAQRLADQGNYQAAKEKLLIPMILGFIFQYIIGGVFILLAYLKFDPVISWQRNAGQGAPPGGWAPQGQPAWGGQPQQPVQAWGQPQQQGWGQPSMGAQPAQAGGWSSPPAAQQPAPAAWSAPAQPVAQPAAPTPVPMAPAAPSGTMCPRCNKPATWVAQYNRWYCYSCAQYV
jgi:hypothetical protein